MNASGKYQRCLTVATALMLLVCCGWRTKTSAQENSLFSGAGIRSLGNADPETADAPTTKPWPGLFGRSRATDETHQTPAWPRPKFGLFKNSDPDFEMNEAETSRPTMFGGFPRLFPERDPDRPPFFQDFNERTKAFFTRPANDFSGWASRKNETPRNKSFDTWDSMTRGLKRPFSKPTDSQLMTHPPLNSAQRLDEKPSVKF
jgi:hypothetical protein